MLSAFMLETVEADTSTIVMAHMPEMLKSVDVEVLCYQHSCKRLWKLMPQQ